MIPSGSTVSKKVGSDDFVITYPHGMFPSLKVLPNGEVRTALTNEHVDEDLAQSAKSFVKLAVEDGQVISKN